MGEKKETPLGWLVNLLHLMLQASTVLVEDIDQQLRLKGEHFKKEKKQYIKNYTRCIEQARYWIEKFGLDTSCWEAVKEDSRAYSNIIADANELIRVAMLYVDRAHTEEGYYKIFRFLRSLPENGIFPEKYIGRFQMHHVWVPGPGDKVHTNNYGNGVLELKTNGDNWIIRMDDGSQRVLKESQFKLI